MDAWIDFEQDWALAQQLALHYDSESFRDLVARVWSARAGVPTEILERRLRGIYDESAKHEEELSGSGWMGQLQIAAPALELGCGTGGFLVPAAARMPVVGVDVSLAWLITAKKRLEESGLTAPLACACAERLPFPSGSFAFAAAFDVLEHVSQVEPVIAELSRVLRPGGLFVATTPNRFSLSAEPHVGLWGVGLLPRRAMAGYVNWRRGMDYSHTHPQSFFDLKRELSGRFHVSLEAPEIWEGEIERFRPL